MKSSSAIACFAESEIEDALSAIRLMRTIPDVERRKIVESARIISVPSGRVFARRGNEVSEIFFIIEGGAKVCRGSSVGRESTVALLGAGAHVGVVSLLTAQVRTTDVVATCRTLLLSIDAHTFRACLARCPTFSYDLLVSLALRLNQTSSHLVEHTLLNLAHRLVLRLFEMAEIVDWGGGQRMLVRQRPSHQELGNMLGASREAITRALRQLDKDGHIEVAGDQVFLFSTPDM